MLVRVALAPKFSTNSVSKTGRCLRVRVPEREAFGAVSVGPGLDPSGLLQALKVSPDVLCSPVALEANLANLCQGARPIKKI